ncbi:hypothetical protein [Leptolyngbya sp. FACHB-261]|uniref:hypothetical protein n=1 Tax=Leptolyngbya sp. FACHB-261 TaxID=2692806 RepID=UPI001689D535|nr:hypothetical protein [Leptolyngbya sp. FACHB-261]MBD2104347.1 hypothetical protein [Leptolyngbya sp. FACHB-261]
MTGQPPDLPPENEAPNDSAPGPDDSPPSPLSPPQESAASPPPALPPQDATALLRKAIAQFQQFWQVAQPWLRRQAIVLLRAVIRGAEYLLVRLETEPAALPPSTSVADTSIAEVATAATPGVPRPQATTGPLSPVDLGGQLARIQPLWQQAVVWLENVFGRVRDLLPERVRTALESALAWGLDKTRAILPASLNERLSDRGLVASASGALLVLLFTLSSALSPAPPPKIAVVPPPVQQPTEKQPTETTPPLITPPEVPSPPAAPVLPPELTAPEPETPPVSVSPPPKAEEPEPERLPQLTPEQSLIASMQSQVSEVTNSYAPGLIQAIRANFQSNRLTVQLGSDWYNLAAAKQDQLMADLLKRSRDLDFSRLLVVDAQDQLVARNPVVGENMVIFQR